ncbi:MAG: hypothetical protein II193_01465 [Lachnospiraceae bacterium]|nr:hypothetical protein [Lachnospiraceae bacterium]
MLYRINMITEDDGWIAIDTSESGPKPAVMLAQSIAEEIGGTVWQPYPEDAQFMIKGDKFRLMFQYDDVFGTVVILNDISDKEQVVELLERHFEKIKNETTN